MTTWQLQHAKARLSELIRKAREEGPQIITVRGREEFVVLRREAFDALGREPPAPRFATALDAFRSVLGLGVDLEAAIGPRAADAKGDNPLVDPDAP